MEQEAFGFFFVLGGRRDGDGKAEDILALFVRGLGEDGVFAQPDGDIAHFVDRRGADTAEILHARQDDMDELVEERLPVRSAERHLIAHDIARTDFEIRDGFFGAADRGGLPRDARESVHDEFEPFFVFDRAHAAGDDYFHDARRLHRTRVAEVALQRIECVRLYCCCFHPIGSFTYHMRFQSD